MTKPDQFTFIACESGAKSRCIGKEYRKRIRAWAMSMSWSQKKENKNVRAQYQPIHKAPGVPFCHTLLENRQCGTASMLRSILALGSTRSNVEGDGASRNDFPRSVHAVHLFMRGQKSLCQGTGDHSHTSVGLGLPSRHEPPASDDDIVETRNIRWAEEEYLGLPVCSPSCCGVGPFTSSIAPINLRMHSYLQYYLDHVLPILHPIREQTAILKDALLAQLNRSPLVLYSTLSIASLRVDNYSNRYDELLLYSKWTDSQLPVPHSFRFKTKTVHLLLHAMRNPGTESVPYVVFALICLITYELLVENIQEAKIHFRGLRNLLRSHGGLERICAADVTSSTISEMHNIVHEMERYAEHCVDDDSQQPFLYRPDEEALSRYLAAYSRFPTLIGQAPHALDGLDLFAVDRQSAEIVDEMVATECFWHMGCRNDKSLVLKALIGTDSHEPLGARNMSELDRPRYSTVDKLPDENEAKSPLTRHGLSKVHDCFR